jgi:plasmid replication initiation protein
MNELTETEDQIPSILNNQVSITNLAARGAQGFTLREKRLFMAGLSKLDKRKSRDMSTLKDRTFRVTADEYAELAQIAAPKAAYQDLMAACTKLEQRKLRYKLITPKGEKLRSIGWVSSLTYHLGEGWVEFSLTEEIAPHVVGLSKNFTKYRLQQASELRSLYSWRLLELLTSHNDGKNESQIRVKKFSLVDFRNSLEIPDSYKYDDIKRQVIQKAVEELMKKDHWLIQWRPTKEGRAVVAIEFTFSRDPQSSIF